jgi:apolipoprotein N-acyltransferase
MTLQLPLMEEESAPTFYHRHGDWFEWACAILAAIVAIRKMRRCSAHPNQ